MMHVIKTFSFAGRDSQIAFAIYAAIFAVLLGGCWVLGSIGVLPDTFAREQELFWFGIVVLAVPIAATIMRRLNDTTFPGGLLFAAPALLGLSNFLPTVFGLTWAGPILFWLSMAAFAGLAIGLVWPSRPNPNAAPT